MGNLANVSKKKLLIIGLIALAIVVAIALIGAIVEKHARVQDADASVPAATATNPDDQKHDATQFVTDFYAQYTTPEPDGTVATGTRQAAVNAYGSQSAIDHFVAQEQQCIQGVPSSVSVTSVDLVDGKLIAHVTYGFDDAPSADVNVTVLNAGYAYLIDNISCA